MQANLAASTVRVPELVPLPDELEIHQQTTDFAYLQFGDFVWVTGYPWLPMATHGHPLFGNILHGWLCPIGTQPSSGWQDMLRLVAMDNLKSHDSRTRPQFRVNCT